MDVLATYWAQPTDAVFAALASRPDGLGSAEAAERARRLGRNRLARERVPAWLRLLLGRFASPLVLILIVAALVSLLVCEWVDALIVLAIVLVTAVLSFAQEYRAAAAVAALRRRVVVTARVRRDGQWRDLPAEEIVPGDVIELSAGSLVPADARLLEARDCYASQAVLTGETLPVEKFPGEVAADAGLADRNNCLFLGTSLRSGWARAVAVRTGAATVYGGIAKDLVLRPPETEFERGLRRFGNLLIRLMLTVVVAVLAVNFLLQRPTVDTLLFAAALAVGLSPELLPAILTITLAHGARAMAREGVIVKRLDAIENLGSMDVLCTDKTGTLTRGVVELDSACAPDGGASDEVLALAAANARLQTGIRNALDEAIAARAERDGVATTARKLDEIPYDFQRRRLSVVVATGDAPRMITKGAVDNVLAVCSYVRDAAGARPLDAAARAELQARFEAWSRQGYRVLAVAARTLPPQARYARDDETDMTLAGFLLFFDPPEPQVAGALAGLVALGVEVKIVTGDNRYVAAHVAEAIGMRVTGAITGTELRAMADEALWQRAPGTTLFTEIEPNQKERIITALQKSGHVVGYLGDGVNDAPALHAADVGLSVDTAVDVAKDAADFVLLRHDLEVLRRGIDEGRHTFANTLKYVFITTSANFGNMISMALASLWLPFLPLLAKQILLNNFLSDLPAMGIAGDRVDRVWERTPHRWDLGLIRRSMLTFGLISTVFDLLTFAALLALAQGAPAAFRTGWFLESLWTELLILWVIRTYRPSWRSRPGLWLLVAVPAVLVASLAVVYSPLGAWFGFVPPPASLLLVIVAITSAYLLVSEATKSLFYRRLAPTAAAEA